MGLEIFHHELCGKTGYYNSRICHDCKDILIKNLRKDLQYYKIRYKKLKKHKFRNSSEVKRLKRLTKLKKKGDKLQKQFIKKNWDKIKHIRITHEAIILFYECFHFFLYWKKKHNKLMIR
jgi:hypothetical protein